MRYIKWFLLTAGVLFGWLGWGLIKWANLEIAGLILFYFPALALSSLLHITSTDRTSVLLAAALYGIIGFLLGWAVERIVKRPRRV
jgi:hypothetical protein